MRKRPAKTPEVIKRIQELILEDAGCSFRRVVTNVSIGNTTLRRIVKDLRYHSYTMKIRQMLSEDARMKSLAHFFIEK